MKKYTVITSPEVDFDIQDGVDWYKSKSKRASKSFFNAVHKELKRLEKQGDDFQKRYDDIRLVHLPKYPYSIHYRVFDDKMLVVVEAVVCQYTNPNNYRPKTTTQNK